MVVKQNILVITKSGIKDSNSRYAQGGIVSVMSENPTDSVKLHVQDTLKSGAGLSDSSVVEFISKNSEKVIKDLNCIASLHRIPAGLRCSPVGFLITTF